jgi:hypothetical protein
LYFETGEGLSDVFHGYSAECWSGDSRYLGLAGAWHKFVVYDTSSGLLTLVDDAYFRRCESFEGYFVYMAFGGRVPNPEGGDFGEFRALPAVRAYDPATGEKVDVLKADPSSVRAAENWGMEARLEPAPSCPEYIKESAMFKELNGSFAPCWESEA